MTSQQSLNWATQKLTDKKINSANLDAEILLSLVLQKPKEYLYTHPEHRLTKEQLKQFNKLIKRRIDHEPIAYLIGQKEFYGLKFIVNKHVLVPRPESEKIIDEALKIIKSIFPINDQRLTICDIGTGSGCLIISLAKELQKLKKIDSFELIATDISKKALKVAKANAAIHQVDKYINFINCYLLKPLKNQKIDLIIANLPYLSKDDVKNQVSIKKEPKKALIGNYDKFFKQISILDYKPTVIWEDKEGVKLYTN